MAPANKGPNLEKTRRRIVKLLKTEGALDSMTLGARLGVSAMAVRQHLYALQDQRLVIAKERPVPLGRPVKYWELTREADRLFPEAYAELSVSLIDALTDSFGPEGLQQILEHRTKRQRAAYSALIPATMPLHKKLEQLARIRTEEGYMAEVRPRDHDGFLFIENHCPICAAATSCKGLCQNELLLFQSILGREVSIKRLEHIVTGERRCVYEIKGREGEAPPKPGRVTL
ncbi:MAG: transcriptional regulator [Verrucomicrobia bacterium]|nr:transcriptional regulator [Verrucomicrobiota bacterium]